MLDNFEPRDATVLVTDDDVNNLKMVRDHLATWKCRVLIAREGLECLRIADTVQPDLILLDVKMPKMDGFATFRELQRNTHTASIPVIFMTALSALEDKVRAFRAGAVDYIVKPIQGEELLGRIAVHLRLQMMTRTLQSVNQSLERQVTERTRLLEATNETLRLEKARSDALADNLALSLQRAEAANQVKEAFIARLSHELRTPLNALVNLPIILASFAQASYTLTCVSCDVRLEVDTPTVADIEAEVQATTCPECVGNLELLTEYEFPRLNQEQFSLFKDMEVSAEHLLSQVNSLLDISQFDMGRVSLDNERVDVNRLLEDSSRSVRVLARTKGVELKVEINNDEEYVIGDVTRLRQVLINLMGNAVKFTDAPGTIWVRANRARRSDVCVFHVEDTGIGIPPEKREAVFETFRQLRSEKKHGGIGLGLAISKQIVELHQGRIWVTSRNGPGSSFFFTVPISEKRDALTQSQL